MERLTRKDYFTWDADGTIKLTYIEKLQNKLGAFEDLMQKYNIEDLEQLDIMLFVLSGETKYRLKEIQQENQALKDRWEKLKKYLMYTLEEKQRCPKYYKFNNVLDKIQELEKGELKWIDT